MAAIATNNIIDINQYEMPCDPITLDPYQKPTRLLKCGHTMNEHSLLQMINAGNNIIRTLEENGIERPKKYLEYLTKHNIM